MVNDYLDGVSGEKTVYIHEHEWKVACIKRHLRVCCEALIIESIQAGK